MQLPVELFLALQKKFHDAGADEVRGHLMFAMSDTQYATAMSWLEKKGLLAEVRKSAEAFSEKHEGGVDSTLDKVMGRVLDVWQDEAELRTYRQAVAEAIVFASGQGESPAMTPEQWLEFSARASWYAAKQKAATELSMRVTSAYNGLVAHMEKK